MESYQNVQRYHASMGERNKVFRYLCKAIHKFQMLDLSTNAIFNRVGRIASEDITLQLINIRLPAASQVVDRGTTARYGGQLR